MKIEKFEDIKASKYIRWSLIVFLLLTPAAYSDLNLPPLSAQAMSSNSGQNVLTSTLLWRTPIYMAANQYLSVVIHEESHALAARLMGYEIESIKIGFREGGVWIKDAKKMNTIQSTTFSLAGPFSNRLIAMVINSYLDTNENNIDENVRSFLGTAYIWNRGNFAWYLFRSGVGLVLPGEFDSDWTTAAHDLAGKNIPMTYVIMGTFVALEIWDICSTGNEITQNYDRMLGRFPASAGSSSANASSFSILPYHNGFIAAQKCAF